MWHPRSQSSRRPIVPSLTRTPGIEVLLSEMSDAEAILDGLGGHLPLGRTAVADDVARVILFCATDAAMFMTGTTLVVDGGELAH
jgi:NAD(P)-dependent dehydrogenase (short-subunit alcohol dehydrogenase family)